MNWQYAIWASSRESLSSGFPKKRVSNQSPQLQRLVESWTFTSKFTYDTFQKANNEGADQTARMRRLVCACVVRKPPKTGFLTSRPILDYILAGYELESYNNHFTIHFRENIITSNVINM